MQHETQSCGPQGRGRRLVGRSAQNLVYWRVFMQPKRYIVWSKKDIDLSDPWQRKWYIQQVLTYGRTEDIAELDWDEVKKILPEFNLAKDIRRLWEDYFKHVAG